MADRDLRITDVTCSEHTLALDLDDGRTISAPLAWFPRLHRATPEQRANWTLAAAGSGVHWPELDEDLSAAGLLRGERAVEFTG